jgi:phosphopantetheine adenylyltransferase
VHLLVVANETVTGRKLIDAIERRKGSADLQVTVLAPVSQPQHGYVVYEDTRRAAAGRRLDRTLALLREEGVSAHGLVVESDPVTAVRDALAQLEPAVDEIILATHTQEKSGWLRKNVVDRIREVAGKVPVEHVVVDLSEETGAAKNVLVLANETVMGHALLDRIRERAARGNASFLIISPQSDPTQAEHPEAERRLKRALAELRGEGIDAHGQVAQPDPFSAAMDAVREERVDEIIVSTYAPARSPWLRRNLIQRLHNETRLPVEHIVFQPDQVEEGARS